MNLNYRKAVLVIVFFIGSISLQSQSLEMDIYDIYVSGKIPEWEPYLYNTCNNYEQALKQLEIQYAYVAWNIGANNMLAAKKHHRLSMKNALMLNGKYPDNADIHAITGALYGLEIALIRTKAASNGFKSFRYINQAIGLNAQSAQAWLQKANAEFYAPAVLFRNKHKAIDYYHKAIILFGKQNNSGNWQYLNALALTGIAYTQLHLFAQARQMYLLALKAEPNFHWVKNDLLPNLEKKK